MKQRKRPRRVLALRIARRVWAHPSNQAGRPQALARAAAWQGYKRIVRRPVTKRVYGTMKLRMHPDSGSASNFAYFGDYFEYDELTFVSRYLRLEDNVIDGGANIGAYTLLAATKVGLGRIDAYEPAPLAVAWLRENVALNRLDNVVVHEAALSQAAGKVKFTADLDVSNEISHGSTWSRTSVDVVTEPLDSILDQRHYAFAKLDLEGAELEALRGASRGLVNGNPAVILLEVTPGQLGKFGTTPGELLGLLEEHGYDLVTFDAASGLLHADPVRGNVLAIHKDQRSEVAARLAGR